jgi:hypothetical protein
VVACINRDEYGVSCLFRLRKAHVYAVVHGLYNCNVDNENEDDDSFEAFLRVKKHHAPATILSSNTVVNNDGTNVANNIIDTNSRNVAPQHPILDVLASKTAFELQYALDRWYDILIAHTYETRCVDVDVSDVRALVKGGGAVSSSLMTTLEEAVQSLGGKVFVKLHTRSPK